MNKNQSKYNLYKEYHYDHIMNKRQIEKSPDNAGLNYLNVQKITTIKIQQVVILVSHNHQALHITMHNFRYPWHKEKLVLSG